MDASAKKQPSNWREARRLRAWELQQKGWKQKDIAAALGVSAGAVSQWLKQARARGSEGLRHRQGSGAKPRLTAEQLAQLPALLERGAEALGFRGNVWTLPRVAEVIKREFGLAYHPAHVGRILKRIGWSRQKPVERASQRHEAAIEQWRTTTWGELQKKPSMKDGR
jgi:transposase